MDSINNLVFINNEEKENHCNIHRASVQYIELIDSTNLLLSISLDSDIKITNLKDCSNILNWFNNDWIKKIKMAASNRKIAFQGWDNYIKILDIYSGTIEYERYFEGEINDFFFNEVVNDTFFSNRTCWTVVYTKVSILHN